MRHGVVERGKVKITDPTPAGLEMRRYSSLEGRISILPTSKEERALWLLEDIAEYNAELQVRTAFLHSCGGEVSKRLQDDLVFEPEQGNWAVETRRFWDVHPLRMLRQESSPQEALPQVVEICLEGNLICVVQTSVQSLVLLVASGRDSPPCKSEIWSARELGELHDGLGSGKRRVACLTCVGASPPAEQTWTPSTIYPHHCVPTETAVRLV